MTDEVSSWIFGVGLIAIAALFLGFLNRLALSRKRERIGLVGQAGPAGEQGYQGERGEQGEPGPAGPQGERGPGPAKRK